MKEPLSPDSGFFVTADPFRCRAWDLSDRIEEYVTEDSCSAEIVSVERDGQLVPVVGRLLKDNPDFDIEVICGTRRLFIARHLKIPIRVELRELTDRQAAVAMETENFLRKQTSPYERGLWLAKLLRQQVYSAKHEMAKDLRITPTQVTRLLKFAELPAIVIGAFPNPHEILESWAVELHKAWKDDRRRLLIDRCRSVAATTPRPSAASVYETLIAPPKSAGSAKYKVARRVVKGPDGTTLLCFEQQRNDVVLRIPNFLIDPSAENQITDAVTAILSRRWTIKVTASGSRSGFQSPRHPSSTQKGEGIGDGGYVTADTKASSCAPR